MPLRCHFHIVFTQLYCYIVLIEVSWGRNQHHRDIISVKLGEILTISFREDIYVKLLTDRRHKITVKDGSQKLTLSTKCTLES